MSNYSKSSLIPNPLRVNLIKKILAILYVIGFIIAIGQHLITKQVFAKELSSNELRQLRTLEKKVSTIHHDDIQNNFPSNHMINRSPQTLNAQQSELPPLTSSTINNCGEITTSGTYYLNKDLDNPNGYGYTDEKFGFINSCIHIHNGNNITLDCQGHKIDSQSFPSSITVAIEKASNFTIKNCTIASDLQPLKLINTNNGIVQGNTFNTVSQNSNSMVSVQTSTKLDILHNTFHVAYWSGPYDPHTVTLTDTSYINIHYNIFSMLDSTPISLNNGLHDSFSDNVVDGHWDGAIADTVHIVGADDGPVLFNQDSITVSNNSIQNVWDCGIETLNILKDSTISHNTIHNAGYCGIGGWYGNSWLNNKIDHNTVDRSSYLFALYFFQPLDSNEQYLYFKDNIFTKNTFAHQLQNSYVGHTGDYSSFIDYGNPNGVSKDRVKVSNNIFKDNDFDKIISSPLLIPPAMITDQGGNQCLSINDPNHPLHCIKALTPTPIINRCNLFNQGDANCDSKIDLVDFNIWRKEFLSELHTKKSDFNNDGNINLIDFNIWRNGFWNEQ